MAERQQAKRRPPITRGEKRETDRGNVDQQAAWARQDNVHGEGNYKAAREFDESERKFVQSGKVEEASRSAAPKSEAERRELSDAEEQTRRRAKEEDPALLKKKPK